MKSALEKADNTWCGLIQSVKGKIESIPTIEHEKPEENVKKLL